MTTIYMYPEHTPIRVDQAIELKRYFREETPWGKNIQASEKRVWEKMAADDKPEAESE